MVKLPQTNVSHPSYLAELRCKHSATCNCSEVGVSCRTVFKQAINRKQKFAHCLVTRCMYTPSEKHHKVCVNHMIKSILTFYTIIMVVEQNFRNFKFTFARSVDRLDALATSLTIIWKKQISISTKNYLLQTCILSTLLCVH